MNGEKTNFNPEGDIQKEKKKLEDFNTFLESLGECLEIQFMSNPTIVDDLKEKPLTFDQILMILEVSYLETDKPSSWEECDAVQKELITRAMKDFTTNYGDDLIIVDTPNGPEITVR